MIPEPREQLAETSVGVVCEKVYEESLDDNARWGPRYRDVQPASGRMIVSHILVPLLASHDPMATRGMARGGATED